MLPTVAPPLTKPLPPDSIFCQPLGMPTLPSAPTHTSCSAGSAAMAACTAAHSLGLRRLEKVSDGAAARAGSAAPAPAAAAAAVAAPAAAAAAMGLAKENSPPPPAAAPGSAGGTLGDPTALDSTPPLPALGLFLGELLPPSSAKPSSRAAGSLRPRARGVAPRGELAALAVSGPLRRAPPRGVPGERPASRGLAVLLSASAAPLAAAAAAAAPEPAPCAGAPCAACSRRAATAPAASSAHATAPSAVPIK